MKPQQQEYNRQVHVGMGNILGLMHSQQNSSTLAIKFLNYRFLILKLEITKTTFKILRIAQFRGKKIPSSMGMSSFHHQNAFLMDRIPHENIREPTKLVSDEADHTSPRLGTPEWLKWYLETIQCRHFLLHKLLYVGTYFLSYNRIYKTMNLSLPVCQISSLIQSMQLLAILSCRYMV